MLHLSNKSKEKKKKRNINNDLAVLPSYDKRFDHETKIKARSERQNLQAASQLCANK